MSKWKNVANVALNATTISGYPITRLMTSFASLDSVCTDWFEVPVRPAIYQVNGNPNNIFKNYPAGMYLYGSLVVLTGRYSEWSRAMIYIPDFSNANDFGYTIAVNSGWNRWNGWKYLEIKENISSLSNLDLQQIVNQAIGGGI